MHPYAERARRMLPGLWAGWQLCVALLATPPLFALLPVHDAGRIAGRMLAQEAYTSLALGVILLVLERLAARRAAEAGQGSQFSAGIVLALATLLCTIAGWFVIEPMMADARAGHGPLSFGALHAISATFFGIKGLIVLALAWRAATPPPPLSPAPCASD
ncbi:MAG: DUF4149 domain-containing protein [Burkholderiales bacterium]|nr:DUF4149 domain-containing protein [Burkholderiales bacterium]MDE1926463.1 DUF4149 domain-containing protein [Burkholderiales bacterium]MDE2159384.1 DUF4149 domain-containing protein [Burkholderiales bacterium]MDE2503300.1 DUF4149 domain-containing protein [Burkholderiales bacterium]